MRAAPGPEEPACPSFPIAFDIYERSIRVFWLTLWSYYVFNILLLSLCVLLVSMCDVSSDTLRTLFFHARFEPDASAAGKRIYTILVI